LTVDQKQAAPAKLRSRTRLVMQGVVSLALVAVIFSYLLHGIDPGEVWAEIADMTPLELTGLLVIVAWNLATYALVPVTAGLSFWRIMMVTQAATAVANTVPTVGAALGTGLTYRMLGSWGYSRSRTTTAMLVSGVWNSLVKLGLPVLSLALLALQGNASPKRVSAALVGIAGLVAAITVFALLLCSQELAHRFGLWAGRVASRLAGLVGRPPVAGWELATTKFRVRTLALLQGRWLPITVATLVSHLSLYLVLLVSLRQVGISDAEVAWIQVLTVFAFARLATAVPFTPGGAGVVEAVLITGLVAVGGDREQATAAVLVYRGLTWALPILLGVGCWLWWHQSQLRSQAVTTSGREANSSEANGMANTDRPGCQARDSQPHPVRALRIGHAMQREHITSPEENR
jgi:putative heme transporter